MSDERAVAPTVAASPEADVMATDRLASLVELLRSESAGRLCAVVLSGSLARGEGVVLRTDAGLRLLSDLDLYALLDPLDASADAGLAARARASLAGDAFLLAPLDLGLVDAHYFARLGATLPARQLGHGHRVLWAGEREWSRPGAHLAGTAIDADDATKLLHNRCAEHLLLRRREDAGGPFALFHRWKMWRDAPLAFLAAHDRYHPDRGVQVERLTALASSWTGGARAWVEAGVARLGAMQQALTSPLTLSGLAELAGGEEELTAWIWPFHRALLGRGLGRADGSATLREAVEGGAPGAADAVLERRWLQRRGAWSTLREARRWAPLAGAPVSPWWRHGWGGTGPDRVHVAAANRFAHRAHWHASLTGLVDPPAADDAGLDAWLGGLWSSWIMGGSRH